MTTRATRSGGAVTPEALFTIGAVSQYVGAAIAVGLFDVLSPATVAWLRVTGAAVVIVIIRRPWRRAWSRHDLMWSALFGLSLTAMNLAFYLAIDRLPLGTAVAIEFSGPIAVAAIGTRNRWDIGSLVMVAGGVLLLAEVEAEANAIGVLYALMAGAAWAAYIVLGHRVSTAGAEFDGLAVGMVAGALAASAVGVSGIGPVVDDPLLLVPAVAAGVLSSAVPYMIDQRVLALISRARFALLQALLPVCATAVGLVALGQTPGVLEICGILLVVTALVARRPPAPTLSPTA